MANILMRLTALCMLSAFSEQMIPSDSVRSGVRLIAGLLTAQMILEIVSSLPGAVFGRG